MTATNALDIFITFTETKVSIGLKCGNSINYCLNNLLLNDVIHIAESCMQRESTNNLRSWIPTRDIDASWNTNLVNKLRNLRASLLRSKEAAASSEIAF